MDKTNCLYGEETAIRPKHKVLHLKEKRYSITGFYCTPLEYVCLTYRNITNKIIRTSVGRLSNMSLSR